MMNLVKKIFSKTEFWSILIILVVAFLAGRTLFTPGYFNMHDDLQMMRQLEMEKCFKDLQIPCRWIPDMGYGFGFPLFNFYPPLPYLVGEIFRLVGFAFTDTAKLLFAFSFIGSGLAMYFLAKEFFGRIGGIISAIFYIWAPYHAVDVYVRGAMNEAWSLIWFPLILWAGYKAIKKKEIRWLILLALSWVGLLLSHNLMVFIFTPVFAVWMLIFLWRERAWKKIPRLILSGLLAFGLAAFFTLPAILEQKYVHVDTLVLGYFEYFVHFVSIGQLLISRFWGYGPSTWELNDQMSFQVGHIHWILSLLIGVLWLVVIVRKKKNIFNYPLFIIPFMLMVGWFAAFMTHVRSTPIWQIIPFLKFVQFPWRFLTLTIFSFSFLAGSIVTFLPKKIGYWLGGVLAIVLVIINWNYFLPEGGKMGPVTDAEKFSGVAWQIQQTAGIYDYLPMTAKENPKGPQKELAEIMKGKGEIENPKAGTNWATFNVKVESEKAIVRVDIYQFPNWKIKIDDKVVKQYIPEEEKWGRMWIDVPQGEHQVSVKLENTLIRTISNIISLVTWLGLLAFPLWYRKMIQFKRG
jgi:hypothetical protein